jgi:hypothetical protein
VLNLAGSEETAGSHHPRRRRATAAHSRGSGMGRETLNGLPLGVGGMAAFLAAIMAWRGFGALERLGRSSLTVVALVQKIAKAIYHRQLPDSLQRQIHNCHTRPGLLNFRPVGLFVVADSDVDRVFRLLAGERSGASGLR